MKHFRVLGAVFSALLGLMNVAAAAEIPVGIASDEPALIRAVREGNLTLVRALAKTRESLNTQAPDSSTALQWAARAEDMAMVQALLGAGANAKIADRYGITPLFLAAKSGNAKITQALLSAGADPNAALPEGETVLMAGARTGNPEVIKLLLAKGAQVNAHENTMGETALMWAAAENHGAAVNALVAGGADLNATSKPLTLSAWKWETSGMVSTMLPRGGWTPLMYAARQGSKEAATALADAKADLNRRDPDGATALVLAIINAHFDLAAILLNEGAEPNIADNTGAAALYAAVDMNTLAEMLVRPAPKMTDELDSSGLIKILLARHADVNAQLQRPILGRQYEQGDSSLGAGTTAFMRAVKSNDLPTMRLLLENGADPLLTQTDYTTPIMIAAFGGRRPGAVAGPYPVTEEGAIEVMKICLSKGADINAFNTNGQTAVHLAATRGADKIVQFLADNGAKLDMKDKEGRTPLQLASAPARERNNRPVVVHESTAALLKKLTGAKSAE